MIVLVIISILVFALTPSLIGFITQARDTAEMAENRNDLIAEQLAAMGLTTYGYPNDFIPGLPDVGAGGDTIKINGEEFDTEEFLVEIKSKGLTSADIGPLSRLTHVLILSLDNNQIEDISALGSLSTLYSLSLSYNNISDISALKGMTKVDWLHLGANKIHDIGVLGGLTQLEYLILWNNQINDLSPLKDLTKLRHLDLRENNISDISALFGLSNLRHLDLSGNPVSEQQIAELRAALPNCTILF